MVKEITKDEITKVYSGTPGCCCGCRGKYTYTNDPSKGAKATVTKILKLMNAHLDIIQDEEDLLFLDMGSRWYIAYRK